MYGKWFATVYEGSMVGSGALVFAVWGYCCGKADPVSHIVSLNPTLLATIIGEKPDDVARAIDKLCAPDPDSRCTDHDGRRLLHCGGFDYFVVTHAQYRAISSEEQRREYMRGYMRKRRAGGGGVNTKANESLHTPNPASASVSVSDGLEERGPGETPATPQPDAPPKAHSFKQWTADEFKDSIREANKDGLLSVAECKDFFDYWTEKSASGRFRLHLEKTWDTRLRMQTAIRMVFQRQRNQAARAARPSGSTYTPVKPSATPITDKNSGGARVNLQDYLAQNQKPK